MKNIAKGLAPWVLVIILLGLVYSSQRGYDIVRLTHLSGQQVPENELIEPSLPNQTILKDASMGFDTVIADVLWLETIQYYGGGDPQGKYRQLPKLMRSILTLDPRFTYPYSFAGLILPAEGYADDALQILHDGESILPNNWQIPYSEGTIYYSNKKNFSKAAEYYQLASKIPGAPPIAGFLSAVQYDKAENYQTARQIFQDLADHSSNTYFKDRAKAHIDHYDLLIALENLIQQYNQKEGRYPASLNDLVKKHYASEIPADPLMRKINYDQSTGKVTSEVVK